MKTRRLSSLMLPLLLSAVCSYCSGSAIGQSPAANWCTADGAFIFPDSCSRYYKCALVYGEFYINFDECPAGTLFDDAFSECREESLVTSPLRCVQSTTTPAPEPVDAGSISDPLATATIESVVVKAEDSTNVTDLAAAEVSEMLGLDLNGTIAILPDEAGSSNDSMLLSQNDTEDVVPVKLTLCDLVNMVDSYSTLVISSPLLRKSSEYQNQYNENVMNYNLDLKQAQNSTSLWRHGDSILSGIKNVYHKASGYKDEFKRKLKINERLIQNLSVKKPNKNLAQVLEDEIRNLQEEIKNAEAALAQTDIPAVQQYFERVITTKREQIAQKQRETGSSSKTALELEERINFLEFVMDDATEVESISSYLQQDMETLISSFRRDDDAFSYHDNEVSASITFLATQEETQQKNILDNQAQHEALEKRKELLNGNLDVLNENNSRIRQRIFTLTEKIANDTYLYNRKKNSICKIGGAIDELINENSTLSAVRSACNYLLGLHNVVLDTSTDEKQIKRLERQNRRNHNESSELLSEIGSIIQRVRSLYGSLPAYETRLQQIKSEIGNLQTHATDIKALRQSNADAIESLMRISDDLQELHDTFQFFTSSYQDSINRGRAAGSEDEKLKEKVAINHLISDTENQLDQLEIDHLGNCRAQH